MCSFRALACFAATATVSCVPRVPNPVDVAGVAIDLTIQGVDAAARAASQAGRATPAGPSDPQTPQTGAYPAGAYPVTVVPTPVPVVQARFVGEDGASRWALEAGSREVCTTPCTLRYGAGSNVQMVQLDVPRKPARLDVPYLYGGSYEVRARPRIVGAFAPGVVAAAFGGMGTIAGIALTSVGCSQSEPGLCKGGLVTFGTSSAVLALGIVLVAISAPRVVVAPTAATTAAWP